MKHIAVIGLGQMGATLARLSLQAGWRVHAWNRTPDKAERWRPPAPSWLPGRRMPCARRRSS